MTNQQILQTAMRQSALELNCDPSDFLRSEPVITAAAAHPDARKYLHLPYPAYMVSYGHNVTASVMPALAEPVRGFLAAHDPMFCFEPPALTELHALSAAYGCGVSFTKEYWLPDVTRLNILPCAYEIRMLTQKDFAALYRPEWSNALCEKRRELDVLGAGAYDGGTLVGLAACSADCDSMLQIGVDVLPAYRRQGIAAALTSRLTAEILERGKVPFYCCAWCNIRSAGNAVKSGYYPVWTELEIRKL